MMTEKATKVRYLNDAGIELLRQGHMKNTKEKTNLWILKIYFCSLMMR